MKIGAIILFIAVYSVASAQQSINMVLKKQLDSIMVLDQQYRMLLENVSDSVFNDSIARTYNISANEVIDYLWVHQMQLDSSNLVIIGKMIVDYGYPGKTLVGDSSCEVAFYVIQHSNKKTIAAYLKTIKKVAKHGELPFRLACMMEDRHLMTLKKKQKYGTQGTCRSLKNRNYECFIWPVKNVRAVNKRRKKAGFELTIEQNAARMNIDYRVVKMSEVR